MGATWWFLTYWNKTKHRASHSYSLKITYDQMHWYSLIDHLSILSTTLPAADQLPFLGRQLHRPILDNSLPSQADRHLWLANGVRCSRPIIGHAKKSIAAQLAMYHMHQSKQQRTCSCSRWDMSTSFLCAISLSKQKRKKKKRKKKSELQSWSCGETSCVLAVSCWYLTWIQPINPVVLWGLM